MPYDVIVSLAVTVTVAVHEFGWWRGLGAFAVVYLLMPYRPR